ncbi:MAG TPA: PKD domain-containing protein [Candidatus Absconditabacterales bacterium]|nr:PKD domain-containing protein [Candidatus Absconditabacterales bacterium]
MKKTKKIIKNLLTSLSLIGLGVTFAAIPNQYIANHDIVDDREQISQIFVQIEANNKIGEQTPTSTFSTLNQSFSNIFNRFPQDYDFQVIYQQCLSLTNSLGNVYNYNTFASFMDNCYKPFTQILNKINSDFTVKAKATSNPKKGPAPLNVTFDARASIDPSNETIPSENYFRYYRDTNGIDQTIGVGPVINHTFQEAGNYLVHLTVRSSNNINEGIFDGEKTVSIDVTPKASVISMYANSKKLKSFEKTKFGTQEGEKGIVFDGSATIPIGGRQILSHTREINSNEGFEFTKEGIGKPGIIKVILPKEGEYKAKLTTYDNESNEISEEYYILISDPVAIIKQTPEQGDTSNTFSFDSSPSYSVVSSLRLFTREIFDNNGDKQETFQGKSIKQQFRKPGSYTVKLTVEDELGQSNIDTSQVYVESSDPIAQFSKKASQDRKYPSKFIFDASLSSDIDVENSFDELSYERSFSNPNFTNIETTQEKNKKIEVSFDDVGTQKIKLTVKDKFGKISEIEKNVEVESTLRPEIFVAPKATTRGNTVNFVVKSNQDIINYSRDFGDGEEISTQTNKVTHVYKKVGVYKIKLKVSGSNGMENEIIETVFIGDKNSPIAAYKVTNDQQQIIRQNEECIEIINGEEIKHPAYKIERYENLTIDPSESVNIKGENSDLNFYFQPRNSEIFKNNQFKYSFNELGCQFVDFTAEDTSMGINDKTRIRFKVYNSLPTIDNIVLFFPQYGNEMGVGFNENYVKDIFNTEFDPLIVKVQAMNPKDDDGFISYFKRYYYYKDDPTRLLETKITPGDIEYAYFSLPKIPGEFMFGVTMYDNDDGKSPSEDVIGNGPIVFFPPDTKRPDIPLVTLKSNKTTVEVGDEIIFDVISKVISDKEDFVQERTIMYDFDGDGERDLTTKKDRVSHVYKNPSDVGYTPRAAVLYRGYKGIGKGGNIIVKKGLKPRIMFDNAGTFTIFRDISIGEIEKSSVCLSYVDCRRENEGYFISGTEKQHYSFDYPEYGKYFVSMDISDKYANQATKKRALTLTGIEISTGEYVNYTGDFKLLSIPKSQTNEDDSIEIMVGKNLDNSILFYILYENPENDKECYVDLDISDDTEKDFYCNQLFFTKFDPKLKNNEGKIYYQKGGKIISKKLKISFLDFSIELDEKTSAIYNKTSELIMNIKEESLKGLLLNLQKGILDPIEIQSNVVAIQNYLTTTEEINITDQQKEDLQRIINELGDETTISANGGTDYDTAKAEILGILPTNLRVDIEKLFIEFENAKGDKEQGLSENDQRKSILNKILTMISQKITNDIQNQKPDEITKDDMDMVIMPKFCQISEYYEIPSERCSSEETKIVEDEGITAEKGVRSGLKIIFIILGIVVGLFVIVIVVFAVRARMSKSEEDEEL